MAFFMQHACLHAHEYTVQFTCLKCPNCFSVLHEIFICLDVVSQVFLVVVFLDRSMPRHVAPVPAQLAGAACPTYRSDTVVLREKLCLGSRTALPCSGNELLWGHLPSIHPPTLYGRGLQLYGPVFTYARIRVAGVGSASSMQDLWALHPQAGSSCMLLHQLLYQHLVTSSAALHWLSHHHPCQRAWSKLAQQKDFTHLTCLSIACVWQLKATYITCTEYHIYQVFSDNGLQLSHVCGKIICSYWSCLHAVRCSKFVLGICWPDGKKAAVLGAGISDVFSERWPVTCFFPSGIPRLHDRMTDRWC